MGDIELVVNIPEEVYKIAQEIPNARWDAIWLGIKHGTPLPKGHGRLIDVDNINVIELEDSLHILRHEKGDEIAWYIDAPTIIEADREV